MGHSIRDRLINNIYYLLYITYQLFSCTTDTDIWDFVLGKRILSYQCYLTQDATWVLYTLVVLELTHMAVKWRHCYVKAWRNHIMSHLSVFGDCLEPYFKHKMRYLIMLMVSKKMNPLFVWGWDRKIRPSYNRLSLFGKPQLPNGDPRDGFFYPPSHSWWRLIFNSIAEQYFLSCWTTSFLEFYLIYWITYLICFSSSTYH